MSVLNKIIEPETKEHGWQYKDRKEDGYSIISPSGIKNFYSDIKTWKTNVIDGEQTFFGNEATKLGDIVHKYCELYRKNKLTKDLKLPSVEFDKLVSSSGDIDIKQLCKDYPLMNEAVKEAYLEVYPSEAETEFYMEFELADKVLIAGTIDEIDRENKIIVDFKTSKNPYKEQKDMAVHFMQLCVYSALIEKLEGLKIETFRIVNIARPTKTIGSRITILECDADIEYGRQIINEVYKATLMCRENKELVDILLKPNPFEGYTMPSKESIERFCNDKIKNFKIITQEENKIAKVKKNIFS